MKKPLRLIYIVIAGALLVSVTSGAYATIIQDNTITGTNTSVFDSSAGIVATFSQSGANFAEHFAGQTLSFNGDFDVLTGTPSDPLTLLPGAVNQSVHVGMYLDGCGAAGCDYPTGAGEGAVSVLLDHDTDVFGFDLLGVDGVVSLPDGPQSTLEAVFFARDGSLLGSLSIGLTVNEFFGFRATAGERIAGVSLTSLDNAGVLYDNVTFNQLPDVSPVPEPSTMLLTATGLFGLAGFRRKFRN